MENSNPTSRSRGIKEILEDRKMIVSCGMGGVGKTTLSAALAIRAALSGRKTVVVTIDPAKRLAQSLGMQTLPNQPTEITSSLQAALEKLRADQEKSPSLSTLEIPTEVKGSLFAFMPDTRKTFEELVHNLAPNPGLAERVLKNPIFQIFAQEYSGANEYMALQRLLSLSKKPEYDCIILDTPPGQSTLSFLDSPRILTRFFNEPLVRWMVHPTNKIVGLGIKKALDILEKLTGAGFMTNLLEFAGALFEVQSQFTGSLKEVTELLQSKTVGFMTVVTSSPGGLQQSLAFSELLAQKSFHFEGLILNKSLSELKCPELEQKTNLSSGLLDSLEILEELQARENEFSSLLDQNRVHICARVPEIARDVHRLEDLIYVSLALDHHP